LELPIYVSMNKSILQLLSIALVFSSCTTRKAYFLSPFTGSSNAYYAKPLLADSVKSAIYVTAVYTTGNMNKAGGTSSYVDDNGTRIYSGTSATDPVHHFQLSFHRSHTTEYFQAYYGASISAGTYSISRYDSLYTNKIVNVDLINSQAGSKYFGGAALVGGINMVVPFKKTHEWRIIGVEASLGKEWGEYYEFRKNLPDSSANAVSKTDNYGSIGFTSEVVFKRGKNNFGLKAAWGSSLFRTVELGKSDWQETHILPVYFNFTMQYSRPKFTLFIKLNEATKAETAQFGASYKLSRVRH
jgi:hypothetical protein